ncbi:MAG: shikimate kinase [Acholeplasmataceae bacterium]|nr:MAG: shikimate kinase [Acholeplasmataceae bacterium]
MNIYLIGMPGSGKNKVAAALAEKLNRPYLDLDGIIEQDALMFIDEIFERHGEDAFRRLETKALADITATDAVIACGGGIVTRRENKTLMNGRVILLDVDLSIIQERLSQGPPRPLLKTMSLEALHEARFLQYQDFADLVVSNDGELTDTVSFIIKTLQENPI